MEQKYSESGCGGNKPKELSEMIHMFPDDFYWYQFAAKKCDFSTCLVSQTEPLTFFTPYPPKRQSMQIKTMLI
jgi:hypothetical protein